MSAAGILVSPEGGPIEICNTSDNYAKYIVFPDITLMVSEETEYINYLTNHDGSGVTATTASKDQTINNKVVQPLNGDSIQQE